MADQCGEDNGLLPPGQYALKNLVLKTLIGLMAVTLL
jgi:hypothetical protein